LADTRKKVVVILAVLLTSAATISLILAISRYVGFLSNPEGWQQGLVFRVDPPEVTTGGVKVRVVSRGEATEGISSLLVSTFWVFELSVANAAEGPVDVDFDRVMLRVGAREMRALSTEEALRLFNERMTGAYASATARREHKQVLDQFQKRKLGVARVFPGYTRESLVFFQPHPDPPASAELKVLGIREAGGDPAAPVVFHLSRPRG